MKKYFLFSFILVLVMTIPALGGIRMEVIRNISSKVAADNLEEVEK